MKAVSTATILAHGRLAVVLGVGTVGDVRRAALQAEANPGSSFGEMLRERGSVTPAQLDTIRAQLHGKGEIEQAPPRARARRRGSGRGECC